MTVKFSYLRRKGEILLYKIIYNSHFIEFASVPSLLDGKLHAIFSQAVSRFDVKDLK